jgi:hypothetical protein
MRPAGLIISNPLAFRATEGRNMRRRKRMLYIPDSKETKTMLTVKLNSPFRGNDSTAAATVLGDGGIQLDLYDYSDEAQSSMGHDVAWFWTVETAHKPRLIELLEKRTGATIQDDQALLDLLAHEFSDVHAIRDWLRENNIPYEERFDSSA